MIMSQSNTHEGDILVTANEDLSTYADVLVAPYNSAGQLVVTRPAANNDYAVYVLVYGAPVGGKATVRPLDPNRTVRVMAKGTGNPGDLLVARRRRHHRRRQGQGAQGAPPPAARIASSASPRRRSSTASSSACARRSGA